MSVLTVVLFVAGLGLLLVGAEMLVRGASSVARASGISPLVIGLTVVAYGTSAPELAVALGSSLTDRADIGLGNVIGSNISNILLILGLTALAAPLAVQQQLVRLDIPVMIVVSVLLLVLALNERIGRIEGLLLAAGAIIYTWWLLRQGGDEYSEMAREYARTRGAETASRWAWYGLLIIGGLGMLLLGAQLLVDSAVEFAEALGVSELVIGLTVVAIGTSLPEGATSLTAAIRGARDLAVGNIVGSNIFNVLLVVGVTSIVSPIPVAPSILAFDLPVMIAVALALLPVAFTGRRIGRAEGALFFAYYMAYLLYLMLAATDHDALPLFSFVMLAFVVPVTALTLIVLGIDALRRERGAA
jgi:cation:H+ antiporter